MQLQPSRNQRSQLTGNFTYNHILRSFKLLNNHLILSLSFSNATISAPPTTNNPNAAAPTSSTSSTTTSSTTEANNTANKAQVVTNASGVTSKIMHPPEDLSLEELKARKIQFRLSTSGGNSVPRSSSTSTPNTSSHGTSIYSSAATTASTPSTTSSQAASAAATAAAITKAQEVSSYYRYKNYSQ